MKLPGQTLRSGLNQLGWRLILKTNQCRMITYSLAVIFSLSQASLTAANLEMVTFTPVETDQVLNNPYLGWAPSAENEIIEQPHRLVYMEFTWAELEPHPGKYQFKRLERLNQFERWAAEDVKIIMRLILDNPESQKHLDIPKWLYQAIQQDGTWYENEYGRGFSPNYNNPVLIAQHRKLIKKLAERYHNHNQLAFIELGSIGHWGEWHTQGVKHPFPKAVVADRYVQPYLDYFPRKHLLLRRPMLIVKDRKLGLYNDMFGDRHHTYEGFLNWINNGYQIWLTGETIPEMPDFWKHAPSGGEIAFSRSFRYLYNSYINDTLQQARLSHLSWLGPYCPVKRLPAEAQQNADLLLKTMGYRFLVRQEEHQRVIKPGQELKVAIQWLNKGVAPFYFEWPIELTIFSQQGQAVMRSDHLQSVCSLMPGMTKLNQSLRLPPDLAAGEYQLAVAIIDPATGRPGVELAMAGKRPDGRYQLGQVTVIQN